MLRNLILLFAVVLAFPAHGQVRDVITGRYAPELDNFLLNTDCFANTRNISVTATGTVTRTTSTPLRGVASCSIDSSAIGDKIIFATRTFDQYVKGRSCEMRFKYAGDASGYKAYAVRDSLAVSLETQLEDTGSDSKEFAFGFPCGDLTQATTIVFEATAAGAPAFKLGAAKVGEQASLQVGTAQFFGSLSAVGVTGCTYTSTTTSFSNYAAVASCNSFSVTGRVNAPATKIPAVVIPAGSPSGTYEIKPKFSLRRATGTQRCYYRLSDGTNTGPSSLEAYSSASTEASGGNIQSWQYPYTTSSTDTTIQVQTFLAGAGGACDLIQTSNATKYGFDVYFYPAAADTVVSGGDALGWFVDANIGGANPSLGTASVATYTEITDAGLDLVVNSSIGSQPAKILCSGTNSPGTTTCSSGSESLGLAFTIPRQGPYEVCADFGHIMAANAIANAGGNTYFQLIETPLNAQTNLALGGVRVGKTISSLNATGNTLQTPHRNCAIFNFASAGEKAVRIMYEQLVTDISASLIIADRLASSGQRDIHFTVRPAINFDKINGSLAQIDSALQTTVKAPGLVKPKTCFYNFGGASATLAAPTICTTGTCVEVFDSCSAVTPPARAGNGAYDSVVFANGTFKASAPITCHCSAWEAGDPRDCVLDTDTGIDSWSTNASGGFNTDLNTTTTAGTNRDTYVALQCTGQEP